MKTILVTGGAKGLGAAICTSAAKAGYRVGVLDLQRADGEALIRTLPGSGHVALQADVSNEAQVSSALREYGIVPDVLVNNAGIVRFGPLLEQSVEDFKLVMNVHLLGTYIVSRVVAPGMVKRGHGAIINMSSLNAVTPGPNTGSYAAAKAGIVKLTEQMSLELGPSGVRVNSVAPGFIDGGMSAPIYADPAVRALRGGATPLRRLGTVDDIANAVLWLASEQSSYITGHQLVVDGGVAHSVLLQLPRKLD
jgi:NAD(P)-dependent dehydrogenase (short-subunit alcohol dehydrogenase family)